MVRTLYKLDASPGVRSIRMTLRTIEGLDINMKDVNLFGGESRTPEYLKMNPAHTVPVLDDNGFIVNDSHAINAYLISKYAKDDSLYPKDVETRSKVDTMLHFDSGKLFPLLFDICIPIYFQSKTDVPAELLEKASQAFETLNLFLEGKKYLTGFLSIADFCCIATITSLNFLVPIDGQKYPNIVNWMKTMKMLPYYSENQDGLEKHIALLKGSMGKK